MDNKKNWYIAGAVVLVLLIVFVAMRNSSQNGGQSGNSQDNPSLDQMAGSGAPMPEGSGSPSPAPGKLSYGAAINAYKFRFQFTQCHASPGMLSVEKNSPVMFDNRDKVAHTFKANGQTFKIAALDYAIIYPQLPTGATANLANSNMTCDGGGAGTLNVEK